MYEQADHQWFMLQGKMKTQDSNEEDKQQERNSERMKEDKQTSDDEKEQSYSG